MEEEIKTSKDEGDIQIYELGYHILPIISEEEVGGEVAQIHSIISAQKGNIISEGAPTLRPLAYEISKKVETKTLRFNKAYFGWVKFEADRKDVATLQNKIESLPNILRFLIVKTVKENTMHTPKTPIFKKETVSEEKVDVAEKKEKVEVSEAEIDKSIDELLVNENSKL
jgi:ribosomal protein S6